MTATQTAQRHSLRTSDRHGPRLHKTFLSEQTLVKDTNVHFKLKHSSCQGCAKQGILTTLQGDLYPCTVLMNEATCNAAHRKGTFSLQLGVSEGAPGPVVAVTTMTLVVLPLASTCTANLRNL